MKIIGSTLCKLSWAWSLSLCRIYEGMWAIPLADFLQPPDQLVMKEETVKVTLALTKESVDFFKEIAREKHTLYQTMIRALLEQYKKHYRALL